MGHALYELWLFIIQLTMNCGGKSVYEELKIKKNDTKEKTTPGGLK